MGFLKQNKLMLIGTVLILGLLYFIYAQSQSSGDSQQLLSASDVSQAAGSQDLLVTLASLHTIRLDDTIFKDPAFVSLTDFGVVIPPEAAGRHNPFEPLSGTAPTPSVNLRVPGH